MFPEVKTIRTYGKRSTRTIVQSSLPAAVNTTTTTAHLDKDDDPWAAAADSFERDHHHRQQHQFTSTKANTKATTRNGGGAVVSTTFAGGFSSSSSPASSSPSCSPTTEEWERKLNDSFQAIDRKARDWVTGKSTAVTSATAIAARTAANAAANKRETTTDKRKKPGKEQVKRVMKPTVIPSTVPSDHDDAPAAAPVVVQDLSSFRIPPPPATPLVSNEDLRSAMEEPAAVVVGVQKTPAAVIVAPWKDVFDEEPIGTSTPWNHAATPATAQRSAFPWEHDYDDVDDDADDAYYDAKNQKKGNDRQDKAKLLSAVRGKPNQRKYQLLDNLDRAWNYGWKSTAEERTGLLRCEYIGSDQEEVENVLVVATLDEQDSFSPSKEQSDSPRKQRSDSPTRQSNSPSRISGKLDVDAVEASMRNLSVGTSASPRNPAEQSVVELCGQRIPLDFTEFAEKCLSGRIVKLGEATFSEVFVASLDTPFSVQSFFPDCCPPGYASQATTKSKCAVKILPFGVDSSVTVNDEPQTNPTDLLQELRITRSISELDRKTYHNFVRCHGTVVVQGLYPEVLLKAWDRWDAKNESENDRPDFYEEEQLYCVILLEFGGNDLEHTELENWEQARSIIQQLAYSLSSAEKYLSFEHRDLHWGNVLIQNCAESELAYQVTSAAKRGTAATRHVDTHGVRCCIIDFTFSRLTTGDGQVCHRPYDDDAYFEGAGDYQFDIYRSMREIVRTEGVNDRTEATATTWNTVTTVDDGSLDWSGYHPRTNVYWMHYLVDKLLNQVTYACDRVKRSAAATTSSRKPKTTRSTRSKRGDDSGSTAGGSGTTTETPPPPKVALEEAGKRLLLYRSVGEFVEKDPLFRDQ